jgi:RNA polymerase sigma factor (sigma-70 family)
MDQPAYPPAPVPDPADIAIDWIAQYEWLVVREASQYFAYLPGSRDDLLQECRIALLNAADKYDPGLGHSFVAYAATVIANAARRFLTVELRRGLRGKADAPDRPPVRVATVAPDSGGTKPLLDLIADDTNRPPEWDERRWDRVFRCLTDAQEQVVRMRLFDDLTYREVGEQLGFRESRANFLFHEAIRRLRDNPQALDEM